jgi:Ca2+-binding RTX toxin-like protein
MAIINGTAANNSLNGTASDDTIDGFAGNDTLNGLAGNDVLYGGDGNDLLNGGLGADTMYGGLGNDTYVVDNVGDVVDETGGDGIDLVQVHLVGMYTLTADVENGTAMGTGLVNITGNGLDNKLTGNSAYNMLYGGGGDDTLDGGAGGDYMEGGTGDDTYVVDNINDTVVELVGEGTDLVQVKLTSGIYTLGANVENGTVLGSSAAGITGNALNNYLTGSSGANTLSGGDGDDTLDGGLGNDKLIGGAGNDTYIVNVAGDTIVEALNEGNDHVQVAFTAAGTYVLSENIETATVTSANTKLNVNITGNFLANVLTGNDGNNLLAGGGGNDTLIGGLGNDTLDGGAGSEDVAVISGLASQYQISAAPKSTTGDLQLTGNGQTIIVRGVEVLRFSDIDKLVADLSIPTEGDDNLTMDVSGTINALGGNDTIHGTAGNDTIDGGKGNDLMIGGDGDDVYYVDSLLDSPVENPGGGNDKIILTVTTGTYVVPTEIEMVEVKSTGAVHVTGNKDTSNHLIGGSGANTLTGGDQSDTLDGGLGNDKLIGGKGDDTYIVNAAGDVIVENADEGTDTVLVRLSAAGTYVLSANVEHAYADTGSANINITGNFHSNRLQGNDGNNLLNGGDGNDTLVASLGNDTLEGGGGSMDIADLSSFGVSGDWTVARPNATDLKLTYTGASATSVTLRNVEFIRFSDGEKSAQELKESASTDFADVLRLTTPGSLDGGAGNDTLYGSTGDDTLIGGKGNDVMYGGAGNDTYYVDSVNDIVVENADEDPTDDQDTIIVTMASGTYALGIGNNVEIGIIQSTGAVNLTGNELDNTLIGGKGANILIGGAGNDTLSGGMGADVLTGGTGDDTFLFKYVSDTNKADYNLLTSATADKVTDFVNGEDKIVIDLSESNFAGQLSGTDLDITTSTYFRYNATTGALMFDEDGFGTGKASVNIAILGTTTHPAFLLDTDVMIIA